MRVVAVLLIATATAFVPGHRPRPQPQPKKAGDELYKRAMVSAAGQAALALAITVSSVAPAEAASDRTLKALAGAEVARARARIAPTLARPQVTFGAQDPVFFELPAKRSPKGTPLFGGNKDPKTLFKPPKPTPEFQKPLRFGERLDRNKKAPPTA
jgi:hypothetical protein